MAEGNIGFFSVYRGLTPRRVRALPAISEGLADGSAEH